LLRQTGARKDRWHQLHFVTNIAAWRSRTVIDVTNIIQLVTF